MYTITENSYFYLGKLVEITSNNPMVISIILRIDQWLSSMDFLLYFSSSFRIVSIFSAKNICYCDANDKKYKLLEHVILLAVSLTAKL